MTVSISNPDVKKLLFDILSFEDGWNIDGTRTTLMCLPRKKLEVRNDIVRKLSSTAEMGFVLAEKAQKLATEGGTLQKDWIKWVPVVNITQGKAFAEGEAVKYAAKPLAQRFTREEITLDVLEVEAVRWFYEKRQSFDEVSLTQDLREEFVKQFGLCPQG